MELAGVAERLRNKAVLITGATGFIGKLLVEKVLRLQPDVRRLFLLVRAGDQISAEKRVQSEVPADIVVNAMLCVINCHPRESLDFIYQIGSSMRNPLEIGELVRVMCRYFSEQPFIGAKGEAVKVKELNMPATMSSFYEQMKRHYKEPLQDKVQHGLSTADDHDKYNHLEREYKFTVAVAEAYSPATFFKRRFDDSNMQKLMTMMNWRDRELISCDTKFINWEKYLMEIHIPGVMKCETREITRTRL